MTIFFIKIQKLLLLSLLALMAPSLSLAAGNTLKTPHVQVQLVSEVESVQPGQDVTLGLHFKMIPGWHTYWQNPGDSGEALKVQWSASPQVRFGKLAFPYPQRINLPPLTNYGYEGEVMFLTQVQVPKNLPMDKPLAIEAKATWLVCEEICIPEKGTLQLQLPIQAQTPTPNAHWAEVFVEARKRIPQALPSGQATFQSKGKQLVLSLPSRDFPQPVQDFFPTQLGEVENAVPPVIEVQGSQVQLTLQKNPLMQEHPQTLEGIVVAGTQAFSFTATEPNGSAGLLPILLFALLGGMLLNLMPCVFPVLSIKILSFIRKNGQAPQHIRLHGLTYTVGVLVSFWILAGVLIGLRLGGAQLGWGFQLQSPVFNLILINILFVLALSLLGLFSIGTSWLGLGQTLTQKPGYTGSFFTGVLATVVATPCMAPLVGPAVGLALTQTNLQSFFILSALGFGLALPYLLLSCFPNTLKYLPKPGPWMETFKQAMAFPLFATVIWLLWVFSLQTAAGSVLWVLAGLLVLSFGIWLFSRMSRRVLKTLLPLGLVGLAFWIGVQGILKGVPSAVPTQTASTGVDWIPYHPEEVQKLRQAGKPVFLNFTAAWCLTCQVNDRVVFRDTAVAQHFAQQGVRAFKGDWTNQDATITQALSRYGRQGVPLYVWYGPGLDTPPKVLPEILTKGMVLKTIDTGGIP